jgi:hypothetical protein
MTTSCIILGRAEAAGPVRNTTRNHQFAPSCPDSGPFLGQHSSSRSPISMGPRTRTAVTGYALQLRGVTKAVTILAVLHAVAVGFSYISPARRNDMKASARHGCMTLEWSDRAFVIPLIPMKGKLYCNSTSANLVVALKSEPGTDEGLTRLDSCELGKIGNSSTVGSSFIPLHRILAVVVFQCCRVHHTPIETFVLQ